MIKLTTRHRRGLKQYCDKMYVRAISTKTNRPKAEKWALELIGNISKQNREIIWCTNPCKAVNEYEISRFDPINLAIRNENIISSDLWGECEAYS